jgi:cysteine synthase
MEDGVSGSVVTILCDAGERYRSTIFDDAWLAAQGFETAALEDEIHAFLETGRTLCDRLRPKRPAWSTGMAV